VKQRNKTKTFCFGPCVVCQLGAKERNMKCPKEYCLPLAEYAGTGLSRSTGDGEGCRDNFRPARTKPNFVDLPGPDPTQQWSSTQRPPPPGLKGKRRTEEKKKGEGDTCALGALRRKKTNGPSRAAGEQSHGQEKIVSTISVKKLTRQTRTCLNVRYII
jgi:hypothetical protein